MAPDQILAPGEDIKPEFTLEEAGEFLREIFGLRCSKIEELNGYDDKNYKVVVREGGENGVLEEAYVLKIMNSLDSRNLAFVEGCNALLKFLEEHGVSSPRLVPTQIGDYYAIRSRNGKQHVVRLLEFIPGTLLHQVHPANDLLFQAGQFVAQLDQTMESFHHPVYDTHRTIWHLDCVPKLRGFVFAVDREDRKTMVLDVVRQFEERVLRMRDKLQAGMIHGDFNEQNVVVHEKDGGWRIKAILDFGDSHYSCYLYEVAVAMTYMMLLKKNVEAGGHVVAGYSSVRRISSLEFELLKVCVCARLCQSLVIGAYTHLKQPENLYLLTTAAAGWELLTQLWKAPEEETLATWKSIIEKYHTDFIS